MTIKTQSAKANGARKPEFAVPQQNNGNGHAAPRGNGSSSGYGPAPPRKAKSPSRQSGGANSQKEPESNAQRANTQVQSGNGSREQDWLLLDEQFGAWQPSVAMAVGLHGAIVLQRFHYRLSKIDYRRVYKGERWILGSYEDWQTKHFPFWNVFKIQRVFLELEKRKLIVSCQPEGRASRRKYYRIDYEALDKAVRAASRARAQQHSKSACSNIANLHVADTDRRKRKENDAARARERERDREQQQQRRQAAHQSSFSSNYQYHQDQPAQSHIKWPEFAKWCQSQRGRRGGPGVPTESGFWKWMCGQKPYWRDKVRKDPAGEVGYVLHGKFYTEYQANELFAQNPTQYVDQFRKAIRRPDGTIKIA